MTVREFIVSVGHSGVEGFQLLNLTLSYLEAATHNYFEGMIERTNTSQLFRVLVIVSVKHEERLKLKLLTRHY